MLATVARRHDASAAQIALAWLLRQDGVISGGMIPKVDAALRAAKECPKTLVKIAPAEGSHAVLEALEESVGTRFDTQT